MRAKSLFSVIASLLQAILVICPFQKPACAGEPGQQHIALCNHAATDGISQCGTGSSSPQYPLGKAVGIKDFACIIGIEDPPNWWKASQTLVRSPLSEGLPYSRNPMVLFPVMDFAGEE